MSSPKTLQDPLETYADEEVGLTMSFEKLPQSKVEVMEAVLDHLGVAAEEVATRAAIYFAGPDMDGAKWPAYFQHDGHGPWKPELRLIPIPEFWRSNTWVSENAAAVILPPPATWPRDADARVRDLDIGTASALRGSLPSEELVPLKLPAQVLAPLGPPDDVRKQLENNTRLAYLQGEALLHQPWDVVRVVGGEEIARHHRLSIRVLGADARREEQRFLVYACHHQCSDGQWRRIPDPSGDGFSELTLYPSPEGMTYTGKRHRQFWHALETRGTIQMPVDDQFRLVVAVVPPNRVYGPSRQHTPAYVPGGVNYSSWKWLVIK